MKNPLISVGITAFNAINTIKHAVDSALSQTWPNLDIVIVDDFSTDGTYEFLIDAYKHIEIVRIFKNHQNLGVASTRNFIIKIANGEFLAFFDDDDESLPSRLAIQYNRIIDFEQLFTTSPLSICHTSRYVLNPMGKSYIEKTIGSRLSASPPYGINIAKRILLGHYLRNGFGSCATCSQMARLTTYKLLEGFDASFLRSEDTDFCIRLAMKGAYFLGVEKPLVIQSMTLGPDKNIDNEHHFFRELLVKHRPFIEKYGNIDFCLLWIEFKYALLKRNMNMSCSLALKLIIIYPLFSLRRSFSALRSIKSNFNYSIFFSSNPHKKNSCQ